MGSGVAETQAKTLAEGPVELLNGNLASRTDIAEVKVEVAKVEAPIATVEADLVKWLSGAPIA